MEQETGQHIQEDKILIEGQKHNNIGFGRPWSGWTGTNVVERFVGLRFQFTSNRYHWMRVNSGGPQHGVWHEIRVMGDITEVIIEPGVSVQLLDFYHPGRGNPVYVKSNNNVLHVWNPAQ